MILFGEKNFLAGTKSQVRHLAVRTFVPVYERTRIEEVYKYPTGLNFERIKILVKRYERRTWNYFVPLPTSKPKTLWAIARLRRTRQGQLNFFQKILGEK